MKYFEGDSSIQNTDEDIDLEGSLVEVIERILPHKMGRVRFRDTTWNAISEEELEVGSKVVVNMRSGNNLIVKAI